MISMVSTVPDTRSRILSTAVSPSSVYAPDAPKRLSCDTSVVVGDGVSIDINSVYLYPSRNY